MKIQITNILFYKLQVDRIRTDSFTAANILLAIGGMNGFVSTEVQSSASVLRLSDSTKNPPHCQVENRYLQSEETVRI